MSILHEKLYAYLVGLVDQALTELDTVLANPILHRKQLLAVYEKLKGALAECEDRYIDVEDDAPTIIVLPIKTES